MPQLIKVLALIEDEVIAGAARNLLGFCRAAREFAGTAVADIETSVVTYTRGSDAPTPFALTAQAEGLTVDLVTERYRFDPRVLRQLRRVVTERQPDVLVSYHVKSHFLVRCSGLARRYVWLPFHHGYTTTDLKMRAYNQLDRWSLPAAALVLTVCESFARELCATKGVRPERVRVQHNSLHPAPFDRHHGAEVRAQLGFASDEKVILAAGRFSQEKGHVDLIEAFGHLRQSLPGHKLRLVIAGAGPERERLEHLAATWNIAEYVTYAGQVPDVGPYYAASDVMALPSHSEGSPFVLLESMAAGVPVVATAVGGVPEMVQDNESALLVPARQPPALAAALARVLTQPELAQRLTRQARELIATRYAPQTSFQALAAIYAEAVRQRPRVP